MNIVDIKTINQEDLQFIIKQDRSILIISCSHNIGRETLKDLFENNRFFRTAFLTARIQDINTKKDLYWLVDYLPEETCHSAKIAKREFTNLNVYYYNDKIILSKYKLNL